MPAPDEMQLPVVLTFVFQPTTAQEVAMGGATLVTILGMWLCWGAPRYRMSLEERVKDGKMTEDVASKRIRQSQWLGPLVTTAGVGLLAWVVTR